MLRLLIEDSEGKSKLAPINPENAAITIGRKEGNVIRLKERNVSRNHARIFSTPEGLFVEPVAARYGLKLNSKKIEGSTPLQLGDEIKIGDYRLYIQDENRPQVKQDEVSSGVTDLAPSQQPRFVVISSNFAGREYPITRTKINVGRQPTCEICIEHQSVSSKHAEVRRNARGNFEIRDMGSSNGTKVNGIDLGSNAHELVSGDMVILGHVMMRYCAPGELWYFNFGGFEETKKSNTLLIILFLLGIVVAIVGTVFLMFAILGKNEPPPPAAQPVIIQTADDSAKLLALVLECQIETKAGNFDEAQHLCDQAADINRNDTRYIVASDALRREINAHNDLLEIEANINQNNENLCKEALRDLNDPNKIPADTQAAHKLNSMKLRAQKCLEDIYAKQAMAALDNDDIAGAEAALAELRQINNNSSQIKLISDAIQRKRPAGGRNPGGRTPTGQGSTPTAGDTTPPPSRPNVSALVDEFNKTPSRDRAAKIRAGKAVLAVDPNHQEVLCNMGILYKMGETCEAVKVYKKVRSGSSCYAAAQEYLTKNEAGCK